MNARGCRGRMDRWMKKEREKEWRERDRAESQSDRERITRKER